MTRSPFVLSTFASAICCLAQTLPNPASPLPTHLPGNGLAQHDFMYTGESHDRRIFIVRQGEIVWTYDDPAGKGEISDAVMLSSGNILFAHQFGVSEINPDKKSSGIMMRRLAMRFTRRRPSETTMWCSL